MDFGCLEVGAGVDVTGDFINKGYHVFPQPVDAYEAGRLLHDIRAVRDFDESLFLSEADFDAAPQYTGVNPRLGRNMLERFERRLGFVEAAPQVTGAVHELLGPGYRILDRKVVCGVPSKSIPDWLKARIHGNPVNNLGAYVKPEYRDVTYFYGIDFHQDLIDHRGREADFVTLYVYLHPVSTADAPLYVLENSHCLGATVFPHALNKVGEGLWSYTNGEGEALVRQKMLTGPAGYAAMWHACTLHGTQPDASDEARISLRYLIAKRDGAVAGIDEVNARLEGPVKLGETRVDLADDGSARIKANAVNAA